MVNLVSSVAQAVVAAAPQASSFSSNALVRFFQEGGAFMYVNLFSAAAALAVIVDRLIALFSRFSMDATPFMDQITKLVQTGNLDRAVKLCTMAPNTPLAQVVKAGLLSAPRGELEVAKSIEEAILEFTPQMSTRISWLWSIANVATLFGLIGTITGLIETFRSLTNLPAEKKQELLSNGISTAMNNTAFGLLIAVTCIIFHLVLSSYSKKLVDSVELSALKLENLLGRSEISGGDLERSA